MFAFGLNRWITSAHMTVQLTPRVSHIYLKTPCTRRSLHAVTLKLREEWECLSTRQLSERTRLLVRNLPMIVFDVETASGNFDTCILQLAALGPCLPCQNSPVVSEDCTEDGKQMRRDLAAYRTLNLPTYSKYMLPTTRICYFSQKVHGISLVRYENEPRLRRNDVHLPAVSSAAALTGFISWLEEVGHGKPVLLVAHNGYQIDMRSLLVAVKAVGLLDRFRQVVFGFMDTLQYFTKEVKVPVVSLSALHDKYIGGEFPAHDAVGDAQALAELISTLPMTAYILDIETAIRYVEYRSRVVKCAKTYKVANQLKFVGAGIVEKLAGRGISMPHLLEIHLADPERGIQRFIKTRISRVNYVGVNLARYLTLNMFKVASSSTHDPHWQRFVTFKKIVDNRELSPQQAFLLSCHGLDSVAFNRRKTGPYSVEQMCLHAEKANQGFIDAIKSMA